MHQSIIQNLCQKIFHWAATIHLERQIIETDRVVKTKSKNVPSVIRTGPNGRSGPALLSVRPFFRSGTRKGPDRTGPDREKLKGPDLGPDRAKNFLKDRTEDRTGPTNFQRTGPRTGPVQVIFKGPDLGPGRADQFLKDRTEDRTGPRYF
jgi:hypothetical protein